MSLVNLKSNSIRPIIISSFKNLLQVLVYYTTTTIFYYYILLFSSSNKIVVIEFVDIIRIIRYI